MKGQDIKGNDENIKKGLAIIKPTLIVLIVIGILVFYFIFESRREEFEELSETYEEEYISEAEKIASEYGLDDASIELEHTGNYSSGDITGNVYRKYNVIAESAEFQELSKNKKLDFLKSLNDLWVRDADFLINPKVFSDDNEYKLDTFLGSTSLVKNDSEYFSRGGTSDSDESRETPSVGVVSLDSDEKFEAWYMAEGYVESNLKAPSTAEFPRFSEDYVGVEDGNIVVNSWVEAENSFGAMIRSNFIVVMDRNYELLEIYID